MTPARARAVDAVAGALLLGFAGTMAWAARREPPPGFDPLGSGTAPLWVAGALGLLSAVLLAKALLGLHVAQSQQSLIVGLDGEAPPDYALRPWLAAFVMVATIAYAGALSFGAGFLGASVAFLAILGLAMCERTPRQMGAAAAIAVIGGVAIDALFRRLLLVQLP